MKLLAGAASLLALTLFLSPVMAQDAAVIVEQPVVDQPVVEQPAAEQPVVQDAQIPPYEIPADILALLSDTRGASELSDEELQTRAKAARRFAKTEGLPEEIRVQLVAMFEASRAEMEARKQAAEQPKAEPVPAPQPEQQAEPAPAPQPEQQVAPAEPAPAPVAEAAIPDEVTNLLNDARALADIDSEELKNRAKAARRFAKNENLPQDVRDKLNAIAQDARIEMTKRDQPQQEQQAAPVPAPKPEPAAPEVAPPKEVIVAVPEAPPPPPAEPAPKPVVELAPAPAPAPADVKELDSNAGDPASEKQARAYLTDPTDLATLSDDALRARLDGVRELMASNELSRDTERAIRKKLKIERDVLRERVAKIEIAKQQAEQQAAAQPAPQPAPAPKPGQKPVPVQPKPSKNFNLSINIITNLTPPIDVLRDRRRSEELELSELQRRIEVYNDAQYDEGYEQDNRDYWHASVQHDRELLRRRMIAERHRREAELAMEASDESLDIEIDVAPPANRPRPKRDVFAAEVDDEELEDVLVAPPRKSFKQRYSVEEIAVQPKLRETVSRIEIDTIRFGFNESFIREEQVGNLDGIGAIIERIVKKYPNEVFMIEGHTDAVGSDAYNNVLSKQRAEAVKRALSAYYVIPARNLRTVGLGERFLKIPTADQEPENRRVSISRITQLLSEE